MQKRHSAAVEWEEVTRRRMGWRHVAINGMTLCGGRVWWRHAAVEWDDDLCFVLAFARAPFNNLPEYIACITFLWSKKKNTHANNKLQPQSTSSYDSLHCKGDTDSRESYQKIKPKKHSEWDVAAVRKLPHSFLPSKENPTMASSAALQLHVLAETYFKWNLLFTKLHKWANVSAAWSTTTSRHWNKALFFGNQNYEETIHLQSDCVLRLNGIRTTANRKFANSNRVRWKFSLFAVVIETISIDRVFATCSCQTLSPTERN